MANFIMLTVFLFLFFATIADAEKKKSDKIIIHVPYKIHKHHHTHTKYKVITIPSPKKENTVIYLKEQIQPVIKEIPTVHTQVEITEPKVVYKAPEVITPPHQESAQSFLETAVDHKSQQETHTGQPQEYTTISDDQKPLESHLGQNSEKLIPNFTYKPVILPSHENLIHHYTFKPFHFPSEHSFIPKYNIQPNIHYSYEKFIPKYQYQPLVLPPHGNFHSLYNFKPILQQNPKILHDSVAHTTSQVFKSVVPGPKSVSYKVREENNEGESVELMKNQLKTNAIRVPSLKQTRKGKTYVPWGGNYQLKNINAIPSNDYEYEHVGYLIIDGNSRKIVGKNLKDELRLSR